MALIRAAAASIGRRHSNFILSIPIRASNPLHGSISYPHIKTDFIIVLRNTEAIRTFGGNAHFSVGAGLSAAAGIVGRAAEADLRAGDGGCADCYTYSCSKGAFVGCSLEGSVVRTRTQENCRFYGNSSINSSDILFGSMPRPPAASILYNALSDTSQLEVIVESFR